MDRIGELQGSFSGRLLTDADDAAPLLVDWRRQYRGRALAVAMPDSPEDVARVVRWCAAAGVVVVPQGGNTGLSGGAVPGLGDDRDALLLSLARLTRIRRVDPAGASVAVDAGCTLAAVQQAAAAAGRLFPLSLASEGSCTIGGNLATNAGGIAVLRYGNARALCLGLEVVTADGALWDGMRALAKDNSGYALKDLYIGSEGTLGVITGAVLRLFPRPAARATALVAVPDPEAALRLMERAQAVLDANLVAFELIGAEALALVLAHVAGTRAPLEPAPWTVLMEATSPDPGAGAALAAAVEALLAGALEAGIATDAVLAQNEAQAAAFWTLRESIAPAQAREGRGLKHDISVPVAALPAFLRAADAAVRAHLPAMRLVTFGHLGDGNLHYNMSAPAGTDDAAFVAAERAAVGRIVHDLVAAFGGSISAEHGLGLLRRDEAARYRPEVGTDLMRRIKRALDPANRMNPGKLLPPDDGAG